MLQPAAMSSLRARVGRAPGRPSIEILRWLTGWALCAWAARLLARAAGWRRDAEVHIEGDALHVARRGVFWGRTIRESREVYALDKLVGVRRHVRYPSLHLAVAACAFGVGVLLGAVLLLDAVQTGISTLFVGAGVAVALGAAVDLVLRILVPGLRGRVALEVDFGRDARVRLLGVEAAAADELVDAIARRLEAG